MSKTYQQKNMEQVPNNYGYIVNDHKIRGCSKPVEQESVVKLVDTTTKHNHIWKADGFNEYKLNKNETDEDGWITINKNRKLISSVKIIPCPHELFSNGECHLINNNKHNKHHYTEFSYLFSFKKYMKIQYNEQGKPYCKYNQSGCWEKHSELHQEVFVHKYKVNKYS